MSSKPLGTRSLKALINGVERWADVNNCEIVSGPASGGWTSFAAANKGGDRDYSLKFTATQDPADPDSIWRLLWDEPGTEVDVVLNPYGGDAISVSNPAYQGTLIVAEPDGTILGGGANTDPGAKFTVDLEWRWTEKPTEITAGTYSTL